MGDFHLISDNVFQAKHPKVKKKIILPQSRVYYVRENFQNLC
jgi:hypothetical protein